MTAETNTLFDSLRRALNQLTDHGSQNCLDCLHWRDVAMDAVDKLEGHAIRVTWSDHEPNPGEGRDDLRVLLNRGDWSVPWVRREVAALLNEVERG